MPDRYIQIDEEGYVMFDGARIEDVKTGADILQNLRSGERGQFQTTSFGTEAIVEAFDEPLVIRHIEKEGDGRWIATLPYELTTSFDPADLSVDDFDRFHGRTSQDIPFVFSRAAQFEFFDLVDEFDDDSITIDGRQLPVTPWLNPLAEADNEKFWNDIYQSGEAGWELGEPAQPLQSLAAQLKLARSKVLVLCAGSGHDAAFFAKAGHMVTAVDMSAEAVDRMAKNYGDLKGMEFVKSDIFRLEDHPEIVPQSYDLVFEHTCFCAINPERRQELVRTWDKYLKPGGHLLGVFFVMDKRTGPPFGATEWELRERLRKKFDFLYWTRWRHSIERRKNRELVVYAKKRD